MLRMILFGTRNSDGGTVIGPEAAQKNHVSVFLGLFRLFRSIIDVQIDPRLFLSVLKSCGSLTIILTRSSRSVSKAEVSSRLLSEYTLDHSGIQRGDDSVELNPLVSLFTGRLVK